MSMYELIMFACLVVTHFIAYHMGKTDAPEPFKPSDQAWLAAQCYAIDKQHEYARWATEREESEKTAPSGD